MLLYDAVGRIAGIQMGVSIDSQVKVVSEERSPARITIHKQLCSMMVMMVLFGAFFGLCFNLLLGLDVLVYIFFSKSMNPCTSNPQPGSVHHKLYLDGIGLFKVTM